MRGKEGLSDTPRATSVPDQSSSPILLSFYDHHRQSYGALPIREERAVAEFMVGDYGSHEGLARGGEFAIYLYALQSDPHRPFGDERYLTPCIRAFSDAGGSLRAFIESGAWDLVAKTAAEKKIRDRDDFTALLLGAGLKDRSDHPVGHQPVCDCCGRPTT